MGPANGSWKHGKYSTYMPDFYKEKMAALAALGSDPSGHVEEIHLVEARILELCENLNTGESQEAWKELGEHFEELMLAVHADAEEHIESHASQIRAILQGSKGRDRLWTQINRQIEFRRRLSESQLKKEVSLNALFTIKEVVMILSAISAAVQDNVQDQKALQAIQAAFERAMPQQVPSTQDGETLH